MTLSQIAGLVRKLVLFLGLFADCFGRREPRELLRVYVQGQLSEVHRKTAEAIALEFGKAPRTLQRFLESIKWDEERFHDRCQQILARDHAHLEAIGVVDESGVTKSGHDTVGVGRQWNGHRGKVDNCVVGVHLSYAAPGFQCLLGSGLYLPEDWANDPSRRKKTTFPTTWSFVRSRRSLWNSSTGHWVTEFVSRLGRSTNCTAATASSSTACNNGSSCSWARFPWTSTVGCSSPRSCVPGRKSSKKRGRAKEYPRLARYRRSCEVRNLARYSPVFRERSWQRYRIKDTDKGPEVWEVKWAVFWRKGENGLPGRRHCLIVARNVLTAEVKYFVANRVPGEKGITLRWLLRVAFGRWSVERCFRVAKDELGMDHYQVRGWRCLHRHFYLTQASYLFCARIRQQYDRPDSREADRLTIEQVRNAVSTCLSAADLKPAAHCKRHEKGQNMQRYYQRRNGQSGKSHTKTKLARLNAMGINVNQIKSCII